MTECGPVVLWSVVPVEVILAGAEAGVPPLREVRVDGRLVLVAAGADGRGTVVRLFSGQAQDYLDARFQPGATVMLERG